MPFEVFLFRNVSRLDLPLECGHSVCSFCLPPCPSPPPLSPTQHLDILPELQLKRSLSHSNLWPDTVRLTTRSHLSPLLGTWGCAENEIGGGR